MKGKWHILLAPAALLFQAATPGFIYLMSLLAYGNAPVFGASVAWAVSIAGLAFLAVSGIALTCAASYLLLTRSRGIVAGGAIAVFCVPAGLLASLYLHAVLVFLAWV